MDDSVSCGLDHMFVKRKRRNNLFRNKVLEKQVPQNRCADSKRWGSFQASRWLWTDALEIVLGAEASELLERVGSSRLHWKERLV